MDKSERSRYSNTNMIQVKELLQFLVTNGYEFEGTREAVDSRYRRYPDDAIADFSKDIKYSEENGNYINDSKIKVSVHFEKRADYTNFKENEKGDNEYIGDPETFITGLIEEIKDSRSARGSKYKRKKRKTRKNKSSRSIR